MNRSLRQTQDSEDQQAIRLIAEARHHDPFSVLGRHFARGGNLVRAYLPNTGDCRIEETGKSLHRVGNSDVFEWHGPAGAVPDRYRLRWTDSSGNSHCRFDPYCFPPAIPDFDLHLIRDGRHWHIYRVLGANEWTLDGVQGILFATWAPNAERVSVVGDFNDWDGRRHPMRARGETGIWELFLPGIGPESLYKFEIRNRQSGAVLLKADPYGRRFEMRPSTAAVVQGNTQYVWDDNAWMESRQHVDWQHSPMSIYEVHAGSWQRDADDRFLNYRTLADRLVGHVSDMGFTHVELLPITEHPLDASWGYQTTGYFAPTSRFGHPDDFRYLVDLCHRNGIGVLLDWVPGHFPRDSHALANYDGTALFEHADPRRGEHRDWGTLIFNYGRKEVCNFLLSSAIYWLEEFHLDGLRVDAVASMLYLDYSREAGDWLPNIRGGRENLEAIEFLQELNRVTHGQHPGTFMIAEESTSWPQVSKPTWTGGLGFSMKWNMGWMHDTLQYMQKDPIHRQHHHDRLTFGMLYAFTENFVLPFSHDEVVHGKGSMIQKMPGDEWQRYANLRVLYTYMYTYPGKKLLFMGSEFAQGQEWTERHSLDWHLLQYPHHEGMRRLVKDLNHLYQDHPTLHRFDFEPRGFEWLDCDDAPQSVLSYLRKDEHDIMLIVLNLTPVPRYDYRVGVPRAGFYREVFNSDASLYGGTNSGNHPGHHAEHAPCKGHPFSLSLVLPPLAGVIFRSEN